MDRAVTCLHCHKKVVTDYEPGYGTFWVHSDGYRQCEPTYAAPRFE